MKHTLTLCALATLVLATPAHAVEAVQDGGFDVHDPWVWSTPFSGMFGNWNVPGMTGTSLQLGRFGGIAGDYTYQALDLSGYTSATLSFDLTTVEHGAPDSAYFGVSLGYDNEVYREWLGSAVDGQTTTRHLSFLVTSPNAFTTNSILDFAGANEDGSATRMWVDNVSVQAVPEPASLAVFGLGILGLRRHRAKR